MPDPFETLRSPIVSTDPDPSFALTLRARIEQALQLPRGVTVSDLTIEPEASEPTRPGLRHGDVAYASVWVPDVERASSFFSSVLGWRLAPGSAPQGRQVEGTTPGIGLWGGQERSNLMLCYAVDDIDLALERVRAAGGQTQEPRREPYGVIADCQDSQGTSFSLVEAAARPAPTKAAAATATDKAGDLAYLVLEVVDGADARSFYASVLDWRFTPGGAQDGWEVTRVAPMVGLVGGQEKATVVPMYRVDDITAAVDKVRAAGGMAADPERHPYGITSNCTDDQGTRFYLGQL